MFFSFFAILCWLHRHANAKALMAQQDSLDRERVLQEGVRTLLITVCFSRGRMFERYIHGFKETCPRARRALRFRAFNGGHQAGFPKKYAVWYLPFCCADHVGRSCRW